MVRSLVLLVCVHLEDTTAFRKSERIVLVLRITAQFPEEAAALAASWALVFVYWSEMHVPLTSSLGS